MEADFLEPSDYELFDYLGDQCRNCGAENSATYRNYRNTDYEMIKCNDCGSKRFFNKKEK